MSSVEKWVSTIAYSGVAKLHAPSVRGDTFSSWVARFGLTGPEVDADADPDGDGLPNAAEFVFSGNPAMPDPWNQPVVTAGADRMLFTFGRNDASESSNVSLTVETSRDLAAWTETFTVGADTATSSPGVSIAENGSDPDTVTVSILVASDQSRFARLKAAVSR